METLLYLLLQILNGPNWNPEYGISKRYKNWIAHLDLRTCLPCSHMHGKIWKLEEKAEIESKLHERCRCEIKYMVTVRAGTATSKGINGADWILKYKKELPDYYITPEKAKAYGWKLKAGNLATVCPDKMIFGQEYYNNNGHLPSKKGRKWNEADINYQIGFRNGQRIVFSNDGLVFVTYDHYKTFFEII